MHSSVCPRASDRKSDGIFFRGKGLRGGVYPLLLELASQRGDNHANNIAQKARILLTVDARPALVTGDEFRPLVTSRNPANAAKRCGDHRSSTRRFRLCF